jgi:hypothetical protein
MAKSTTLTSAELAEFRKWQAEKTRRMTEIAKDEALNKLEKPYLPLYDKMNVLLDNISEEASNSMDGEVTSLKDVAKDIASVDKSIAKIRKWVSDLETLNQLVANQLAGDEAADFRQRHVKSA